MFRTGLYILLFLGLGGTIAAQTPAFHTTVNRDSIQIGEPVRMQISVSGTEAFMQNYQWVYLPDTFAHFEVVNRGDVEKKTSEGKITATQTIEITSFDSGRWVLPELSANGFEPRQLYIAVSTVLVTPNEDYRDIGNIIEVDPPFNFGPWLIGLAVAAGVALLCWYIVRVSKQIKKPLPVKPAYRLSPLEEAQQQVAQLKSKRWPETGQFKAFHDEADRIFRQYLCRQFHLPALHYTNEEILLQLKQTGVAGGYTTELAQALRLNSFVKFAGYQPEVAQAYNSLAVLEKTIQQSAPAPVNENHAV